MTVAGVVANTGTEATGAATSCAEDLDAAGDSGAETSSRSTGDDEQQRETCEEHRAAGAAAVAPRIAAALEALRGDHARRSGRLEWGDFYRIVTRRKFTPGEIAELLRRLQAIRIEPQDSVVPARRRHAKSRTTTNRKGRIDIEDLVLKEACATPTLSPDEEMALTRCYWSNRAISSASAPGSPEAASADAAAATARDELVRANMRLVVHVARSFPRGGTFEFLDIVQEGACGLIRAVERFDPTRGYRFSTYAVWWIRQSIGRAAADTGRFIRLPAYLGAHVSRIRRARHRLAQTLGRSPTADEIATDTGLNHAEIALLDDVQRIPQSIEARRADDSRFDIPARPESEPDLAASVDELGQQEVIDLLRAALHTLDARERNVLRMRFGLDGTRVMTLREVGDALRVSRERARQIERKALDRLASRENQRALRDALADD